MPTNKSSISFYIIFAAIMFTFQYAHAGDSSGQGMYGQMVSGFKKADNLSFDFKRIIASPYTGEVDTASGYAMMVGDDYSRIGIDDRIVTARKDTIYDYAAGHNQMQVTLSDRSGGFKELFLRDYFEIYDAVDYKPIGADTYMFTLKSERPRTDRTNVSLIANESPEVNFLLPRNLSYTDELKRRITYEFDNIDFKPGLSEDSFKIDIPDDCRVVDMTR